VKNDQTVHTHAHTHKIYCANGYKVRSVLHFDAVVWVIAGHLTSENPLQLSNWSDLWIYKKIKHK